MNPWLHSIWVYVTYALIGNSIFYSDPQIPVVLDESINFQCPSEINLPCDTDPDNLPPPDFEQLEIQSTCPLEYVKHLGDSLYSQEGCKFIYARTFEALDECGNLGRCVTFLTFTHDQVPPVVAHCDTLIDLGCNQVEFPDITPELIGASDACGPVKITILNERENVNNCRHVKVIRYRVTDDCGNSTTCRIRFAWTIDEDPPVVEDCQRVVDLGCNPRRIPDPNPRRLRPTDECGAVQVETLGIDSAMEECNRKLVYTYLYTDRCGNALTCTETFIWKLDTVAPVVENCAEVIDLGCNPERIPDFDSTLVKVQDNCPGDFHYRLLSATDRDNGCTHRRIYRYAVFDECNNRTVCRQIYTWTQDTIPPVVENCELNTDLGCNPEVIPEPDPERLSVSDDCGPVTSESFPGDIVVVGCLYSLTYTYLFTDGCGNSTKCFETFTWTVDHEPPTILNCQEGGITIDLDCIKDTSELPPALPAPLLITDDCGGIDVEVLAEAVHVDSCCGSLIRRYGVKDACGNQSFCSVVWTFCIPSASFKLICPEEKDLGCINSPTVIPPPDPSRIQVSGNCGDVEFQIADPVIKTDDCGGYIYYTYIATDHCGVTDSCTEVFRYTQDTVPPVVICPEPVDFGCVDPGFSPPAPDTSRLAYKDNCGIASVNIPPVDIVVINCTYHLTWVYEFFDLCGNRTSCFESFTWTYDSIPPEIACPEPKELGCIQSMEQLPPPDTSRIKATDFCGSVNVVVEDRQLVRDGCLGKLIYTYKASDACNNMSRCEEIFYFTFDTIPPIVVCEDLDLGCNPEHIPGISLDEIEWEDDCGGVELINPISAITFEGCHYFISQAFTLVDACGNSTHCSRNITYVMDTVPPTILCHDLDLGCNPDTIPDISSIEIVDNCSDSVTITSAASSISVDGCKTIITQSLVAVDACGNKSQCSRVIQYTQDTIPPKVVCEDLDLGCNPEHIPGISLDEIQWEDNCGDVELVNAISSIAFEGCRFFISQAFTIVDGCGNSTHCSRGITYVIDTVPPTIRCADLDLGCNPDSIPDISSITIVDNCDDSVTIESAASSIREEGCTTIITQSMIAVDACGNKAECSREIRYTMDTLAPVILNCPDSVNLGCNPEVIPGPDFGRIKVEDNCGIKDSLLAFVDFIPDGCHYQVGYLYVFFDSCGNSSSCLEKFAWTIDTMPPAFHTDYCDALANGVDFGCTPRGDEILKVFIDSILKKVWDDCDSVVIGVNISDRIANGCDVQLHLKITAMDACGQSAVCEGDVRWTNVNPDIPVYEFPADTVITNCVIPDPPVFDNESCGPCRMELVWTTTIGNCSSGQCTIYRLWVRQCCRQAPESHFQVIRMDCQIATLPVPEQEAAMPESDDVGEPFIPLPDELNAGQPGSSAQDLLAQIGELTIHPNPAVNELNVNLTGLASNEDLELRIYDDYGQIHWSQEYPATNAIQSKVDVSNLPSGTYSVVVSDGKQIWYKRFIRIE